MSFASLAFLLFLPTVWVVYWAVRKPRAQNLLLVAASYFFYGWWDARFCLLLLGSSLVDFWIARRLFESDHPATRKWLLGFSIGFNIGLLAFFKYCNFFIDTFVALAGSLGLHPHLTSLQIILPAGISFYTFQTLSYTIDVYRRRLEPTRNLTEYLTFVSFFPQLVAGPIERAARMLPQFQRRRFFNWEWTRRGLRRVAWGLFKKIVIADTLAPFVSAVYDNPTAATPGDLALATILFAFQIYCDFSGYSDIAIGCGQMFGIKLMRNFAYPYFSQSLQEFWRRWHISLSTWFRDYVYIPLGGNRVSKWRQRFNVFATFVVSGLWHGAAWRFAAWGAIHGGGVLLSTHKERGHQKFRLRRPGGPGLVPRPLPLARILLTFSLVCAAWVFFRADSITTAGHIWASFGSGVMDGSILQLRVLIEYPGVKEALWLTGVFVAIEWLHRRREYPLQIDDWPEPLRWSAYALVYWFVCEFSDRSPGQPFIYFQF